MRTAAEMEEVRALLRQGLTAEEVARETGVPVSTVARWRLGRTAAFGGPVRPDPWRPPDAWSYAYLLGLYLGDGHVTIRPAGKTWLRLYLDGAYPGIVQDAVAVTGLTSWGEAVSVLGVPASRVLVVQCAWKGWRGALPQHGPGRKHRRPIVLEDWQRAIVEADPAPFVRGLIHSDGCRTINRVRAPLAGGRLAEYAYPRYFFSNLSSDIRALFCDACDRLGVRWTRSNPRNISISDRRSVAVLDRLVGPKA